MSKPGRPFAANNEAGYWAAFSQANGGAGVVKFTQIIEISRKMQGELVRLVIQQ
ncbi:hypothetical protein BDV06DRAFT_223357 [Aspergillus oleicola]